MRVSIFSVHAAVAGRECPVWTGLLTSRDLNLPLAQMANAKDEAEAEDALLDRIFRYFNRVDEGDGERLENIRYRLPSLSVGDYVTLALGVGDGGITYRIDTVGHTRISGTDEGFRLIMPRLDKSKLDKPESEAVRDTLAEEVQRLEELAEEDTPLGVELTQERTDEYLQDTRHPALVSAMQKLNL